MSGIKRVHAVSCTVATCTSIALVFYHTADILKESTLGRRSENTVGIRGVGVQGRPGGEALGHEEVRNVHTVAILIGNGKVKTSAGSAAKWTNRGYGNAVNLNKGTLPWLSGNKLVHLVIVIKVSNIHLNRANGREGAGKNGQRVIVEWLKLGGISKHAYNTGYF